LRRETHGYLYTCRFYGLGERLTAQRAPCSLELFSIQYRKPAALSLSFPGYPMKVNQGTASPEHDGLSLHRSSSKTTTFRRKMIVDETYGVTPHHVDFRLTGSLQCLLIAIKIWAISTIFYHFLRYLSFLGFSPSDPESNCAVFVWCSTFFDRGQFMQ